MKRRRVSSSDDFDDWEERTLAALDPDTVIRLVRKVSVELARKFEKLQFPDLDSLMNAHWMGLYPAILPTLSVREQYGVLRSTILQIMMEYAVPDRTALRFAAVRSVLKEENSEFAREECVAVSVSEELLTILRRMAGSPDVVRPGALSADSAPGWKQDSPEDFLAGISALRQCFAAELQNIGSQGKAAAKLLVEMEEKRQKELEAGDIEPIAFCKVWLPEKPFLVTDTSVAVPPYIDALIKCLWRDVVSPQVERARHRPAALVRPVMISVLDFHARGRTYDENTRQLSFDSREVAKYGPAVDSEALLAGLSELGSKLSHDVLRWEVFTGHNRVLAGVPLAHVLEIEGGWDEWADLLGHNPKKCAARIRRIVYAQAHAKFQFPDGSAGNMLIYNEKPARGQRRSSVRVELGVALLPDYHQYLADKVRLGALTKTEAQRARKLVPMLRTLPPLIGRSNEHGAQITMSMAFMVRMREQAVELIRDGGAKVTFDEFTHMADRSNLPRRMMPEVIKAWQLGGPNAAPFISLVDKDRYTLSDIHAAERSFLEDAGKAEINGQLAGQKAVQNRRAAIRRKAGKDRV